jgi:putative ABC transport system permease protein
VEAVPTIFTQRDDSKLYVAVKYNGDHLAIQPLIKNIKPEYNRFFPGSAFEYLLLEDSMENDIKPDRTFALVFGVFSILAIIIGIIGILGLTIITINQNIKQHGIRKVLGADLSGLFGILSKRLIWEFIIAVVIAVPLSFYVYDKWVLNSYFYHIHLNWTYFVFPIIILLLILFIVTLSMALWIFRINPVEALRYE